MPLSKELPKSSVEFESHQPDHFVPRFYPSSPFVDFSAYLPTGRVAIGPRHPDFHRLGLTRGKRTSHTGKRQGRAFCHLRVACDTGLPVGSRVVGGGVGFPDHRCIWRARRMAPEFCAEPVGRSCRLDCRRLGRRGGSCVIYRVVPLSPLARKALPVSAAWKRYKQLGCKKLKIDWCSI